MKRLIDPATTFLLCSMLAGIPLVFLIAPFHSPDEGGHFLRAFAISDGNIIPDNTSQGTGSMVPVSLVQFYRVNEDPAPDVLTTHPLFQPQQLISLESDIRQYVSYPTSAVMTPFPYLPQAIGISIGRILNAKPILLLYFGRLANLLASVVLIYFAINRLVAYRWFITVIALMPMSTVLRSSMSADSITFGLALLLAATITRLAFVDDIQHRNRDLIIAAFCSVTICFTKVTYSFSPIALLIIPAVKFFPWKKIKFLGYTVLMWIPAFATAIFFSSRVQWKIFEGQNIDAHQQVITSLLDPFGFFKILIQNFLVHGQEYAWHFVGMLGLINIWLPINLYWSYWLLLPILLLMDNNPDLKVRNWPRIILGILVVSGMIIISAAQYAIWNPVGSDTIVGVQGRYYLPFVPFLMWVFHHRYLAFKQTQYVVALISWGLTLFALKITLSIVFAKYYNWDWFN